MNVGQTKDGTVRMVVISVAQLFMLAAVGARSLLTRLLAQTGLALAALLTP